MDLSPQVAAKFCGKLSGLPYVGGSWVEPPRKMGPKTINFVFDLSAWVPFFNFHLPITK